MFDQLRRIFQNDIAPSKIGVVLSGGGARAAYQAGILKYIADRFPEASLPIITGVSAGALNAAHIANNPSGLSGAVDTLVKGWESLTADDVYEAASGMEIFWQLLRKAGTDETEELIPRYGLVQTDPMRSFLTEHLSAPDGRLTGITENISRGTLEACAFLTTNYATGQTVAFAEGRSLSEWDRPTRRSWEGPLTVEHIMASTSLPFLFPAVQIGNDWFGDGGIRLVEPLSPAIHLGANRILAISTRYGRSRREAAEPVVKGYPPAAQIFGMLLNAIFLDRLDQDAHLLERVNELIKQLPRRKRKGLHIIELLVIRPSVDLGKLSGEYETELKGVLSLLSKALGSKDTKSPDWLSMILFEPAYASRLLEIGYRDAASATDALEKFFSQED